MCVWLAGEDQEDIVAVVMKLRREELAPVVTGTGGVVAPNRATGSKKADSLGNFAAEVAYVLRTEAHLSAREAAARLAEELEVLVSDAGTATSIPTYSKESFRVYVGKLLKHTSPQMLLHVAHRIRDGIVDRQGSAWPLRGRAG